MLKAGFRNVGVLTQSFRIRGFLAMGPSFAAEVIRKLLSDVSVAILLLANR